VSEALRNALRTLHLKKIAVFFPKQLDDTRPKRDWGNHRRRCLLEPLLPFPLLLLWPLTGPVRFLSSFILVVPFGPRDWKTARSTHISRLLSW
jgi:hypothetical protein